MQTKLNLRESLVASLSTVFIMFIVVMMVRAGISGTSHEYDIKVYESCVRRCVADSECLECITKYPGLGLPKDCYIVDDRDYQDDGLEVWVDNTQVGYLYNYKEGYVYERM